MRYEAIVFIVCLLVGSGAYAQESPADEDLEKILQSIEQPVQEDEPSQEDATGGEDVLVEDLTDEEESTSSHVTVDASEVAKKKGYDAENMTVRRFDRQEWRKIVADKDYSGRGSRRKRQDAADSAAAAERDSKRFRDSDEGDYEEEESSSINLGPIGSPIVTFIVYGVAIAVILYVLVMVLRGVSLRANPKVSQDTNADQHTSVEDIRALEVDRLLKEALAAGNYRLVIRMYFLGLLKKLDEDGFIAWKKDKTNREYLSELFSKSYYFEEVRMLTRAYEEVWYGDHILSQQAYTHIISSFEAMQQKINVSTGGEKK